MWKWPLENGQSFAKKKNVKEHPIIFGIGEERHSVNEFDVAFKNIRYNFDNYLSALDATFKIFHFFGIEFPPESRKVWLIVNELFYKLKTQETISCKLNSLIKNLLL